METAEQLEDSLTAQVAMVYVMSSPEAAKGPLSIANICRIAKAKGTPVFVDAAAEEPLSPNIHIQAGASLVGYSGGKCMRGPQAAGVLLGDPALIQAAWFQAAPHHNYGRGYKVGKEEIMGMLAAVRQWYKRDHAAEWKEWQSWLDTIANRVKGAAVRHNRDPSAGRPFQPQSRASAALGCKRAQDYRHGVGGEAGCRYAAHHGWRRHRH